MEIVLYEPEIPGNTGNIARLCAANHMTLHLIKPLGFSIDDKHVKRAGLDYWHLVDVQVHENIQELYAKYPDRRYFYATTKAKHTHSEVKYEIGDMLVFGPESRGLPESLLEGVEEIEQDSAIKKIENDLLYVQGYYYNKPMYIEDIEKI